MSAPYATEAPFRWDFELERKSIQETPSGDVIVSGYASTWDEDRMLEAFEPGAFSAGWQRFLSTNPQVLWMHDYETPLGVVEDGRIDSKGLWVRCRLDAPAPGSRAEDILRRVVRGSIKAFSVGGRWLRHMTPKGMRIHTADVMEVSIASVPVNPYSLITSVAQKSFESPNREEDLHAIKSTITDLRSEAMRWNRKTKTEPEPRATMLYSTSDPDGDYRRAQAQQRARDYEHARQARIQDGPKRRN